MSSSPCPKCCTVAVKKPSESGWGVVFVCECPPLATKNPCTMCKHLTDAPSTICKWCISELEAKKPPI